MNLIIILGPPAVGKMTVGQELAKLTGYKLLYNHMTVDLVTEFFDFGTPSFHRLVREMRRMIVEEAVLSELPGLISTCVWDFKNESSGGFIAEQREFVRSHGGSVYFAELAADQAERIRRNGTPHRHAYKKKAAKDLTTEVLVRLDQELAMTSGPDYPFPYPDEHFVLNNTNVTPSEAASQIAAGFALQFTITSFP